MKPKDKLTLIDGLVIEPFDTSSKEQRYILTTKDGKHFQITGKLYKLISLIDGKKTKAQLAKDFAQVAGYDLTEKDMDKIIKKFLLPNKLLKNAQLSSDKDKESRSLNKKELSKRKRDNIPFLFHKAIFSYDTLKPITNILKHLFSPWIALIVILLSIFTHYRVYTNISFLKEFEYSGCNYLLLYIIIFISVFFHELGHSSAAKKYNVRHEDIGIGLYLVFPAFYSDVTNVWRLSRLQRAIVDIGGIYFHLIFANLCYLIYYFTQLKLLLATFYAIDFMIFFSINPLFKFDGYWLVSDILGIPNLRKASFQFIRRLFYKLIRMKKRIPEMLNFKPVETFFFGIYAFLSVSFTFLIYLFLIKMLPLILENYPKIFISEFTEIKTAISNLDVFLFFNTLLRLLFESSFCIGLYFILKRLVTFLIKVIKKSYNYLVGD